MRSVFSCFIVGAPEDYNVCNQYITIPNLNIEQHNPWRPNLSQAELAAVWLLHSLSFGLEPFEIVGITPSWSNLIIQLFTDPYYSHFEQKVRRTLESYHTFPTHHLDQSKPEPDHPTTWFLSLNIDKRFRGLLPQNCTWHIKRHMYRLRMIDNEKFQCLPVQQYQSTQPVVLANVQTWVAVNC